MTDQQGNVQLRQRCAQALQVAQPEVDLARRIVMVQPLPGAEQPYREGRAVFAGRCQRGVVEYAQVAAQPDQLHGVPLPLAVVFMARVH
ncbi:hypothetical protein D3C76_1449670 [compost metagenome]